MYGTLEPVWVERHNLMPYYPKGERTLLVVGNYQQAEQEIILPTAYQNVLLNNSFRRSWKHEEFQTLLSHDILKWAF